MNFFRENVSLTSSGGPQATTINGSNGGTNVTLSAGSTPLVTNNTIAGNTAAAIRIDARVNTTGMTFQNNILANNGTGFEVQFIPEPSAAMLLGLAAGATLRRSRKR